MTGPICTFRGLPETNKNSVACLFVHVCMSQFPECRDYRDMEWDKKCGGNEANKEVNE